jgi:hypothetical protein
MSNKVFPSRLQALCRCGAPGLVCCGDTVPLTWLCCECASALVNAPVNAALTQADEDVAAFREAGGHLS